MSSLFASSSLHESAHKPISSRTSLLYALISTFIAGGEVVRIAGIVKSAGSRDDLVLEVLYLALWLAIGLRWGRGAWELTGQQRSQTGEGGAA